MIELNGITIFLIYLFFVNVYYESIYLSIYLSINHQLKQLSGYGGATRAGSTSDASAPTWPSSGPRGRPTIELSSPSPRGTTKRHYKR